MSLRVMSYQKPHIKSLKQASYSTILSSSDKVLFWVVMALVFIGFLSIFSATAPKCLSDGGWPAQFLLKQVGYFGLGLWGLLYFSSTKFDYKRLFRYDSIFAWGIVIALILVVATPLGVMVNGAKRWINLGFMQLQPSEFAKLSIVMLLATVFKDETNIFSQKKWVYAFIPIILMLLFIYMQPNLSMLIILTLTSVSLYMCAGGSWKLFFSAVGGGIALITIGAASSLIKPYQMSRIQVFLNPLSDPTGAGYNIIQSLIAFATGRFFGVGYGGSIQKLQYLPECHTDFIYAIIAEEMGLMGSLLVLGLFVTFIQRGFVIAKRCHDMYGKLLAMGITFTIGFQAFANMSVASSLCPATGVPLPFISYGGSSLIVSMVMVGILLNISRKRIKKIKDISSEQ